MGRRIRHRTDSGTCRHRRRTGISHYLGVCVSCHCGKGAVRRRIWRTTYSWRRVGARDDEASETRGRVTRRCGGAHPVHTTGTAPQSVNPPRTSYVTRSQCPAGDTSLVPSGREGFVDSLGYVCGCVCVRGTSRTDRDRSVLRCRRDKRRLKSRMSGVWDRGTPWSGD